VDFTLRDIADISDRVPCLSKVAPNGVWHIEDVLHTLAAAQEGDVDFTLRDIADISDRVPCLSKVAPNGVWHIEDV
ncbi:hypothetical protein D9R19_12430, partial [Corynebacterium diphtheriae]